MKDIKKIIFVVFILVLLTPLVLKTVRIIDEKPLGGVFIPTEKPVLNDSTWFNGCYQSKQEKYFNENIGLHNTLVRINNQLNFSLFNKTNAEKIIIGKDSYLFENNYIYATTGSDYVGDSVINSLTNKAKQAQDILESNGIKMLFVFAPGKGTFFKEYIPDRYFTKGQNPVTNYSKIKSACNKNNINYIDFNSWFLELKGKTKYPLFPKAGIHWSYYGMYLCADSLIKKTEKDLNKDIPELKLDKLDISSEQRHTEYDLGDLSNLLFPIKTYDLAYPTFSYVQEGKYRPNVLVIGDSFYWNMYFSGIPSNIFKSLEFYYYNSKYYNDGSATSKAEVSSFNYLQEIMKYEYVIILQTDGGLNNFGFGFFDKLINNFNAGDIPAEALKYITAIKNDPAWLAQIEKKAGERGISVDEMIVIDAKYMLEQEKKK